MWYIRQPVRWILKVRSHHGDITWTELSCSQFWTCPEHQFTSVYERVFTERVRPSGEGNAIGSVRLSVLLFVSTPLYICWTKWLSIMLFCMCMGHDHRSPQGHRSRSKSKRAIGVTSSEGNSSYRMFQSLTSNSIVFSRVIRILLVLLLLPFISTLTKRNRSTQNVNYMQQT